MTRKLPSPCTHEDAQGQCPEYATNRGRCAEHQREPWTHRERSARKRGYDAQHEADRKRQLRRQPICQWPGCNEAATQLDHIKPLSQGGSRRNPRNHQSLCEPHHTLKTQLEAKEARRGAVTD